VLAAAWHRQQFAAGAQANGFGGASSIRSARANVHAPLGPQFGGQAAGTDEEEREFAYRKFGSRDMEVYDHILVNGGLGRGV
jgi:hypothetical protein